MQGRRQHVKQMSLAMTVAVALCSALLAKATEPKNALKSEPGRVGPVFTPPPLPHRSKRGSHDSRASCSD